VKSPAGWQALQEKEPALCSPAAGWSNVDGTNALVVWQRAQSVRPPCRLPWQLLQARPGASRPFVWQRSQGKLACGPPSATGWAKRFAHDEVV